MATQDPTTNYGWDLPTVGGDTGAWGTKLNSIIGDDATGIDAVIGDIEERLTDVEEAVGTGAESNTIKVGGGGFFTTLAGLVFLNIGGTTNSTGHITFSLADSGFHVENLMSTTNGVVTSHCKRASDGVHVYAEWSSTATGNNTVTLRFRYRDGAVVASNTVVGFVGLAFVPAE